MSDFLKSYKIIEEKMHKTEIYSVILRQPSRLGNTALLTEGPLPSGGNHNPDFKVIIPLLLDTVLRP